jgi:hypothetical protein
MATDKPLLTVDTAYFIFRSSIIVLSMLLRQSESFVRRVDAIVKELDPAREEKSRMRSCTRNALLSSVLDKVRIKKSERMDKEVLQLMGEMGRVSRELRLQVMLFQDLRVLQKVGPS